MKQIIITIAMACITIASFGKVTLTSTVSNQVSNLSIHSGDMVTSIKLAKEYYMTSSAPDAGSNYDERLANLSKRIKKIFLDFTDKRTTEYTKVRFVFSDYDWATGKTTPKTSTIPKNTYTFYKIVRTTNGDWKGGPTIAGVDRKKWTEGDIPGGDVYWVTGGHGKASTKWTINARYSDSYINNKVASEIVTIKTTLQSMNLPTE